MSAIKYIYCSINTFIAKPTSVLMFSFFKDLVIYNGSLILLYWCIAYTHLSIYGGSTYGFKYNISNIILISIFKIIVVYNYVQFKLL